MVFCGRNGQIFWRKLVFGGENKIFLQKKWYLGEIMSHFWEKNGILGRRCHILEKSGVLGEEKCYSGDKVVIIWGEIWYFLKRMPYFPVKSGVLLGKKCLIFVRDVVFW